MDALQNKQISIERLNLSARVYNALKREGIDTLQDLLSAHEQGTLYGIRKLGTKSYKEIKDKIAEVTAEGYQFEEKYVEIEIPRKKQIEIEKLNMSVRVYNALKRVGIDTLQDLLTAYEQGSLINVSNLGAKSYEEIKRTIAEVTAEDYQFEVEEHHAENESAKKRKKITLFRKK